MESAQISCVQCQYSFVPLPPLDQVADNLILENMRLLASIPRWHQPVIHGEYHQHGKFQISRDILKTKPDLSI